FFTSRRRHTRLVSDWSSDVCSSDLIGHTMLPRRRRGLRAARHPDPERNPSEPEHTRHREGMAPSAAQRNPGGEQRRYHGAQAEGAADQTVLRVGKVELAHQHGRQGGQRGAVQVVDRGGEHEDRQHPPAVARSLVNLGAGLVHWNCHWNSMVATSPAVASLALAFGKYSTVILRPFCTPQPNDASPLPAYITFDGSATSNLTSLCAAFSMVRRTNWSS